MTQPSARYALLSVSDKTGIIELAQALVAAGYTVLSTGGTGKALVAAGVPVTKVSDYTGSPEIMNGRVKTLHPKIHGGILGRRDQHAAEAAAHGIGWIDLVAVNLYPFVQTLSKAGVTDDEAVEQIDIGGPTMVRASAKNHDHVTILVDPTDYAGVIEALKAGGGTTLEQRRRLAARAFGHTAAYDGAIAEWMAGATGRRPPGLACGRDGPAAAAEQRPSLRREPPPARRFLCRRPGGGPQPRSGHPAQGQAPQLQQPRRCGRRPARRLRPGRARLRGGQAHEPLRRGGAPRRAGCGL